MNQYIVVAFRRNDEGRLAAATLLKCNTAREAAKAAESLEKVNAGAIAFSSNAGFALERLSNAKVIKGFGEVPAEVLDQLV